MFHNFVISLSLKNFQLDFDIIYASRSLAWLTLGFPSLFSVIFKPDGILVRRDGIRVRSDFSHATLNECFGST